MKLNNKVDLGKSFERLKSDLFLAVEETKGNSPARYAAAFGLLESRVKIHLVNCTDITMEELQKEMTSPNDLKGINAFDVVEGEIEDDKRRAQL